MVLETVDVKEKINSLMPYVDEMAANSSVTLAPLRVISPHAQRRHLRTWPNRVLSGGAGGVTLFVFQCTEVVR